MFRSRLSAKYHNKLNWLINKKNLSAVKNIKHIRYSCLIEGKDVKEINNFKFTLSDELGNSEVPKIVINIEPENFIDSTVDLLNHTNNKWFINLSNKLISQQVSNLLQLGGNFGLPIDKFTKKKAIHEFIKDVEIQNRHIPETDKSKIRNTIIPFLHRLIH